MPIRHLIFDYDGVFTNDDYTPVIEAFHQSSGIPKEQIEGMIGVHERKYVLSPDSKQFLGDLKKEFDYSKSLDEIAELLNQRGDSGLYKEFHRFLKWRREGRGKRGLSILSNQIAYRVPFVKRELDKNIGLSYFDYVWFSPEVGLQKPFVGVTHNDTDSLMDVSKVNIFPYAVKELARLGYHHSECVFIDDSQKNVVSAQTVRINGIKFENVEQMFRELKEEYEVKV